MIILPSMRGRPLKPKLPISGAVLWLDASQQSSIFTDNFVTNVVNDNDLVYGWKDLSGNNNHVQQTTSSARPKWRTSAKRQVKDLATSILFTLRRKLCLLYIRGLVVLWNQDFL